MEIFTNEIVTLSHKQSEIELDQSFNWIRKNLLHKNKITIIIKKLQANNAKDCKIQSFFQVEEKTLQLNVFAANAQESQTIKETIQSKDKNLDPEQSSKQLLEGSKLLLIDGKFKESLSIFERVDQLISTEKIEVSLSTQCEIKLNYSNDLMNVIKSFKQSLEIDKTIDGQEPMSIANKLNILAETFRLNKLIDESIEILLKSLEIKKKEINQNLKSNADTCYQLSLGYQQKKSLELSLQYGKQAYDILTTCEDSQEQIGNVSQILGELFYNLKKGPDSLKFFEIAFSQRLKLYTMDNKDTIKSAISYTQLLFQSKQFQKSKNIFESLIKGQEVVYGKTNKQLIEQYMSLASVYKQLGDQENTLRCIDAAKFIALQQPEAIQQKLLAQIEQVVERLKT